MEVRARPRRRGNRAWSQGNSDIFNRANPPVKYASIPLVNKRGVVMGTVAVWDERITGGFLENCKKINLSWRRGK
jgi:hypothetical protein